MPARVEQRNGAHHVRAQITEWIFVRCLDARLSGEVEDRVRSVDEALCEPWVGHVADKRLDVVSCFGPTSRRTSHSSSGCANA
jgi:hypothetical protein